MSTLNHHAKADMIHKFCMERIEDVIAGYEFEISIWLDHGKTHSEAEFLAKISCFRWAEFQAGIYSDDRAAKHMIESHFQIWKLGFPSRLSEVYGSYDGNDGV